MDKGALAKFEKIADEMPCMHEFIVNCKLIQTSKSRETCGCPGCMFRRMITSLREEKALVAREDLSEYRLGDRKIIAELMRWPRSSIAWPGTTLPARRGCNNRHKKPGWYGWRRVLSGMSTLQDALAATQAGAEEQKV